MSRPRTFLLSFLLLATFHAACGGEPPINPYPRTVIDASTIRSWDFNQRAASEGWRAGQGCTVRPLEGRLRIQATGIDPILFLPPIDEVGPLDVVLRVRGTAPNPAQFFWTTSGQGWVPEQNSAFHFPRDGEWHEQTVQINANETIERLRFDPSTGPGVTEIAWLRLRRRVLHPLEIESVAVKEGKIIAVVRNHGRTPRPIESGGATQTIPPGETVEVTTTAPGRRPFESVVIVVASDDLPPLGRSVWLHHAELPLENGLLLRDPVSKSSRVEIAPDGSGARIFRNDRLRAVIAPLVMTEQGADVGPLTIVEKDAHSILFRGGSIDSLKLAYEGGHLEIGYHLQATEPCEGPVVRIEGVLEQGLLPGVEYLGHGERSSSKLDIRTAEHIRFAPDPMDVTMPLVAMITDEASAMLTWKEMTQRPVFARPVFATPNFFDGDGTTDHRMALRGRKIDALIAVGPGWSEGARMEKVIRVFVQRNGLPPIPPSPRTWEAQKTLCMVALDGPLASDGGWGHCVQPGWPRKPFADIASTIFRLTGNMPDLPRLKPGGSHARNSSAYLLTGRAQEWLVTYDSFAASHRRKQQPDGSFCYQGKYAEGHFEETASGYCGAKAVVLMEHAWNTGNLESLAAGLKALQFTRRFRTPRGAQTWEVPLHTPDIMASGHLAKANVFAYRITGEKIYLAEARRWALTGLPFVYQWSNRPLMAYATTPVFGATDWTAVNWIGLPVQWCGLTYAEALLMLAEHDHRLNWRKLAEGIVVCGEQMQYPDGRSIGCLPDSFRLQSQTRNPADINPCALVSLRMRLRGELDGIARAASDRWLVLAPFPLRIDGNQAKVQGREGIEYQLIVFDRSISSTADKAYKPRILDVVSHGEDVVELEGK